MLTALGILIAGAGVAFIWSGVTGEKLVPTLLALVKPEPRK